MRILSNVSVFVLVFCVATVLKASTLAAPSFQELTVFDINDDAIAADINGVKIPIESVRLMHAVEIKSQSKKTLPKLLNEIIDQELIAAHARKNFDDKALFLTNKVGFHPVVSIEDQYVATLRAAFDFRLIEFLKETSDKTIDAYMEKSFSLKKEELRKQLKFNNFLEVNLSNDQKALAKKIELISYCFPDGDKESITLWDVYRRQNVQGRVQIHSYDINFIRSKAKQRLASLYVLWWSDNKSGLDANELTAVFRLVENRFIRKRFMSIVGLSVDMHEQNPALDQLENEVTEDEISRYYAENIEKFRIIEKVKARHIRTRTQDVAEKAKAELDAGIEFSAVAKMYSVAKDAKSTTSGDLGWIFRKEGQTDWLKSLALTQKAGTPTKPIRTPQQDNREVYWEIVLVDERVDGYLSADGESVRYIASKDIARKKAFDKFKKIQQEVSQQASIRFNKRLHQQ